MRKQAHQCGDGTRSLICEFGMDDQSWAIGHLAVKAGHRFSDKEVQIPTTQVDRISYDKSTVFVNLTSEAVEQSPAHHVSVFSAAD